MDHSIRLLTHASFPAAYAIGITSALERQFHVDVRHHPHDFQLSGALDGARNQYLSAAIIRSMEGTFPGGPGHKLLCILDVDLYAPVLTFVFGEAQLGGVCAVMSSFRLHNEFYGIPPDRGILLERLKKEAIHETGHLYGLIHCPVFDCVMRSSTYVEEIDLKSEEFCPKCKADLENVDILNNETLSTLRSKKNPPS